MNNNAWRQTRQKREMHDEEDKMWKGKTREEVKSWL